MDMLADTPVEFKYLEILAKTFVIPARQNQFIQENIFNNDSVRPLWYQQFDLRQMRIFRGRQPIVDFDAADNCPLYVTTMKTMNFQDDIPSIPIDNFKDHYVIVFDLTSMQDSTESRHYPELVREQLRLELNFNFPLEHVTELIVLGKRVSSIAVDKFGVVGKNI